MDKLQNHSEEKDDSINLVRLSNKTEQATQNRWQEIELSQLKSGRFLLFCSDFSSNVSDCKSEMELYATIAEIIADLEQPTQKERIAEPLIRELLAILYKLKGNTQEIDLIERKKDEIATCPFCGLPLRTSRAKQCRHCKKEWHDSEEK